MNEYIVTINNKKHSIKISGDGEINIGSKTLNTEIFQINKNAYLLKYSNNVFEITTNKLDKDKYGMLIEGSYFETTVRTLLQEYANELKQDKNKLQHHSDVKAPMPGLLLKLKKTVGDSVSVGEPILILEAMKMENELRSPSSGTVKEVYFREGQSVEKNSIILTIE